MLEIKDLKMLKKDFEELEYLSGNVEGFKDFFNVNKDDSKKIEEYLGSITSVLNKYSDNKVSVAKINVTNCNSLVTILNTCLEVTETYLYDNFDGFELDCDYDEFIVSQVGDKDYTVLDINDYQDRLTADQTKKLLTHVNRYDVKPNICAWYEDWEDFCDDWCDIGYSRTEARELLNGKRDNRGEFKTFPNGSIVRLNG